MKKVCRCVLLLMIASSTNSLANWSGRWDSKGSDAIIGLSTNPQSPQHAKNSLLVIGYSKNNSCQPAVSVLIMDGQTLGSPVDQRISKSKKDQLIISVGTKDYTEVTKLTKYTNGMELAFPASKTLIEALGVNDVPLAAKIGSTTILNFSRVSGFDFSNNQAKASCKYKR